jgi:hypothetical protein
MLVIVLLEILIPLGCVIVCALIGRHYAHLCAEHRAFCDDIEHDTHRFTEQAREFAQQAELSATQIRRCVGHANPHNERTDMIPVSGTHTSEPPLRTHDQLLAGRSQGRHALSEETFP